MPSPPPGAGRGRPGTACAFASSSSSCTSSAQAAPASSTSARNTRWSPATAPVWAAAAQRTGGRGAHLQHGHAHAAVGAFGECLAEADAVAVGLQVHGDRAHALVARELGDPVGGVDPAELPHDTTVWSRSPRLVASVLTATFPLCETSATRPGSSGRSASPQSATRSWSGTMPLPLGPQTGRPCRRAAASQLALELRALGDLAEAGAVDHGAAAAERAGLLDHRRHAGGGYRHHHGVGRLGEVARAWGSTESRAPPRGPG